MALIRTLLRNGMSYGEFDQIARKCFVDVAFRDFAPARKKQTVSNVAILTGLNRKEVKKLHELDAGQDDGKSQQYNRAVRVIGGWINDPRYLRKDGNPRDLDYDGEKSFSELVRQYSGAPSAQVIQVFALKKDGKYEVDYWCDICAIAMFELKACDCCQADIELRERKVKQAK